MKKRKEIVFFMLAAVLAFAALANGAYLQQTAGELFEKALYVEEGQGDLQKAIGLYQDIVKRFPESRDVAAKALLHIGLCYEKLGKEEAQNAYRRIINEYADQPKIVADARARLASITIPKMETGSASAAGESAGFTLRRIDAPEIGNTHLARLSPDGKRLLYIHVQEKEPHDSIRVLDLSTGQSITLAEGIQVGSFNIFEWSPDGQKVVFKQGRGELRLVSSEGGTPEKFWTSPDSETSVNPWDWSTDGSHILASLRNDSAGTVRLVTLPVRGGEPRVIVSGAREEFQDNAHFSPDGKYIAGTMRKEKNTDIYVWAVDGSKEIRITDHPADDICPFWSPDGKHLIFESSRSKTLDLWAVLMNGPDPAGDPVRIRTNLGNNTVLSDMTPGGHLTMFVFSSGERPPDLFVLPVDPKTGEARGELRPFAKYPTQHSFPRWSPDGNRLAYTSRKGNIQLPNIYVSSGNKTEDLEIPTGNHFVGNVEWSRDGKYLIFPGLDRDDSRVGIYRVSLDNFAIDSLFLGDQYGPGFQGGLVNLRWLPLAGQFMFEKVVGVVGDAGTHIERDIYTMDKDGGNVCRVAEKVDAYYWTWPSPDGRYIICRTEQDLNLVSLKDGTSTNLSKSPAKEQLVTFAWSPDGQKVVWSDGRRLSMFAVVNGASRTLVEASENKTVRGTSWWTNESWSPDGTKITYVLEELPAGDETRAELWIIEASGGSPRKIAIAPSSHPVLDDVIWHPSGEMVFVTGKTRAGKGPKYEHWVMENFLPKEE
jgi:Tol biopolymer transport system component